MKKNINSSQKSKEEEKNVLPQDEKIACFNNFLKHYHIDINEFNFENYSRPDFQARSVIFGITRRNDGLDLKQNAIYNFLDEVKKKTNTDTSSDELSHADLIILNIASQLFDRKFKKRKIDCHNIQDIRDTIVWSQDSFLTDQFLIFYSAYLNADIKTCQKLENLFEEDMIKYGNLGANLVGNIKLLSAEFIGSLPENTYHQILDTIMKSKYIFPPLEDEFYQKAGDICTMKDDFFSKEESFHPFLSPEIKDILSIFSLEELTNMSESELHYISGKSKEQLEKIKSFYKVEVEPSKIDRLLCYPTVIQIGYQKIKLIKNQISSRHDSNKVLIRNNNN